MPELPEVKTTVSDLLKVKPPLLGATFLDVWTDAEKMFKKPPSFALFRDKIKGARVLNIGNRGKNILFGLSGERVLLLHQKLTGHLLFGKWKQEKGKWLSEIPGPLREDPMNSFLHIIFFLDTGWMLALSDLRKFAKVELWQKKELENSKSWQELGPEPLDKDFTFSLFKKVLSQKKKKAIKEVIMDQKVIAGIGNIYSSEALWLAKIHPLKKVGELSDEELRDLYRAIISVLKKGLSHHGESISDFRRISGERGGFDPLRNVYRKAGQKCPRCGAVIRRIVVGGRSAYFCPHCQKL